MNYKTESGDWNMLKTIVISADNIVRVLQDT